MTDDIGRTNSEIPPGRAFISHAYADAPAVEKLVHSLPPNVEPVLFAKVDSDPRAAVSDGIVEVVRAATCLIYVTGGASDNSLWVQFERDYASRSGLAVFAFDPGDLSIRRVSSSPPPLEPEFIVSAGSFDRAAQLVTWMTEERSFDFDKEPTVLRMKEIPGEVIRLLHTGAPVVWLIDNWMSGVVVMAYTLDDEGLAAFDYGGEPMFTGWQSWLSANSIFVRISTDWSPTSSEAAETQSVRHEMDPVERAFGLGYGLDLTQQVGDDAINWNRADDLVVRLTMLARSTRPFLNEDDADDDE